MNEQERREVLAEFLRTRRERLAPEQLGLPLRGRRRTPGLRREEVAQEAGMSTTWYTWLEQGRAIQISSSVAESLARVLQLDSDERTYLLQLTGQAQASPSETQEIVSPALQRVLDQLTATPAYIRGQRWDILAWNRAACVVMDRLCGIPAIERNILYHFFCHPAARELYDDWEFIARCMLAQFRANAGMRVGDRWFKELIDLLKQGSPEFRQWWPRHEILGMPEGRKVVNHPRVGRLVLEHTTFRVSNAPHLQLVLQLAVEEETEEKVLRLLDLGGSHSCDVSAGRDAVV